MRKPLWFHSRPITPLHLWLMAALVLCLVLIFSGCTTLPVEVKPQPRVKPAICLQPAPAALQDLQDNFTSLSLDAQARTLLLAHVADSKTYQLALLALLNCQRWVQAQP